MAVVYYTGEQFKESPINEPNIHLLYLPPIR